MSCGTPAQHTGPKGLFMICNWSVYREDGHMCAHFRMGYTCEMATWLQFSTLSGNVVKGDGLIAIGFCIQAV